MLISSRYEEQNGIDVFKYLRIQLNENEEESFAFFNYEERNIIRSLFGLRFLSFSLRMKLRN